MEKITKKLRKLGINVDKLEINPTLAIENHFFKKSVKNYRNATINFCIKNDIDLRNTFNNTFEIIKRFVKLVCPKCENIMKIQYCSGNIDFKTARYICSKCKTECYLKIPSQEGIIFNFKL